MSAAGPVLVTGAAGYIGSRVCARLLASGHDVHPVDNFQQAAVDAIGDVPIETVDVRDRGAVRAAMDDAAAVIHLAAISGVPDCQRDPEAAFDTNVVGTQNVAWCCREQQVPLVFAGSMAMLGDPMQLPIAADHPREPLNLYGLTKHMSEVDVHALAEDAFPAIVLMKSNIYGTHRLGGVEIGKDTVVNIFVDQARRGDPLTVFTPGTQARDFIHIDDVASAYERALAYVCDADPGAETVTIGSGACHSVRSIAETVQRLAEERLGAAPDIALVENPRAFETVAEDFTVETATATDLLGFTSERTVEDAVAAMLER